MRQPGVGCRLAWQGQVAGWGCGLHSGAALPAALAPGALKAARSNAALALRAGGLRLCGLIRRPAVPCPPTRWWDSTGEESVQQRVGVCYELACSQGQCPAQNQVVCKA